MSLLEISLVVVLCVERCVGFLVWCGFRWGGLEKYIFLGFFIL